MRTLLSALCIFGQLLLAANCSLNAEAIGTEPRRGIRFSDMLFAISDEFPLARNSLFNLLPYAIDQSLVCSKSTWYTLCFKDVGPVHELEVEMWRCGVA